MNDSMTEGLNSSTNMKIKEKKIIYIYRVSQKNVYILINTK